ncbi:hypothetical protein AB0I22_17860 [Streptomyces sp. NPDC050610]|uniref:LppU/SCO3897 family protein n=1 Tax=Streptomyces sp. NPDC050610 TaxID=3157097 RepID=UPI0034444A39
MGDPIKPNRRKIVRNRIIFGLFVAALAASFAVNGFTGKDDAEDIQAGDCFENTGTKKQPQIKKHDCGDAHAAYKVLKRDDESVTEISCWDVKGTTGTLTAAGAKDFVVCFEDNPEKGSGHSGG